MIDSAKTHPTYDAFRAMRQTRAETRAASRNRGNDGTARELRRKLR